MHFDGCLVRGGQILEGILSLIPLFAQMCVRRGPPPHLFPKLMSAVPSRGLGAFSLCQRPFFPSSSSPSSSSFRLHWSRPAISTTP